MTGKRFVDVETAAAKGIPWLRKRHDEFGFWPIWQPHECGVLLEAIRENPQGHTSAHLAAVQRALEWWTWNDLPIAWRRGPWKPHR